MILNWREEMMSSEMDFGWRSRSKFSFATGHEYDHGWVILWSAQRCGNTWM